MPATIARCPTAGRSPRPTSSARRKAIASGRYKAVNMAGASVISAILNASARATCPSCSAATARWSRCPARPIEQDAAGARRRARPGSRRSSSSTCARRSCRWRRPRARARRARRPLPGELRDLLRDVRRRRRQLGREGDEGRPLRDRRSARRLAARPHRAFLPLEPDRGAQWRDRLDHRAAGRGRQQRRVPDSSSPTSSRWPASRTAADIPVPAAGPDYALLPEQASTTRRAPPRPPGKRLRRQAPGHFRGVPVVALLQARPNRRRLRPGALQGRRRRAIRTSASSTTG